MTAPTLAEFLLARIEEDEAVARGVDAGPSWFSATNLVSDGDGSLAVLDHDADADHIARHDPARVLADCKAKRAIVHQAVGISVVARMEGEEDLGGSAILGFLAQPYASHPDFKDEWR